MSLFAAKQSSAALAARSSKTLQEIPAYKLSSDTSVVVPRCRGQRHPFAFAILSEVSTKTFVVVFRTLHSVVASLSLRAWQLYTLSLPDFQLSLKWFPYCINRSMSLTMTIVHLKLLF